MTNFPENALKEYTAYGMDPRKRFDIRRNDIHQKLPDLNGYELQQNIEALNSNLADLKADREKCEKAIAAIKQGEKPTGIIQFTKTEQLSLGEILHKFGITWSLSTRPEEITGQLGKVIADRKKTASWIKRERAILLWERRLRKVKALQLPFIRQKVESLTKEDANLAAVVKDHLEQVDQHLDRHNQIASEAYEQETQIRKLSFERVPQYNEPNPLPTFNQGIDIQRAIKDYLEELKRINVGKGTA